MMTFIAMTTKLVSTMNEAHSHIFLTNLYQIYVAHRVEIDILYFSIFNKHIA